MEKPDPMELIPKEKMKRKAGAPVGNVNAWKHGFYSRRFKALELCDLDTILQNNLDDEIALLRVMIRRVFEAADNEAETLDDWERALSTLGSASTRLANLIRAQHLTSGGSQNIEDLLAEAIGDAAHEISERYKK
jgi:uncharacterized protein YjcR